MARDAVTAHVRELAELRGQLDTVADEVAAASVEVSGLAGLAVPPG